MSQRKSRFQKDEPRNLREGSHGSEFTTEQMAYVGCFMSAMLQGGCGLYCTGNASGNNIRMTLYVEGEKWADNLVPSDDLPVVLGDFAKQFGVDMYYRDCVKLLHAGKARAAAEKLAARPGRAGQAESTPL